MKRVRRASRGLIGITCLLAMACEGMPEPPDAPQPAAGAVRGMAVTIKPNGHPGSICIAHGCAYGGRESTVEIPDGTHAIIAAFSFDADGSSGAGTVTVDQASGSFTFSSPVFDSPAPGVLSARTVPVQYQSGGAITPVGLLGIGTLSTAGGEPQLRVLADRRYQLIGPKSQRPVMRDALFSDQPDLFVSSVPGRTMSLVAGAEADVSFAVDTAGVIAPRPARLRIEAAGNADAICLDGITCGAPGADLDVLVVRERRYRIQPTGAVVTVDAAGTCVPQVLAPSTIRVSCPPPG